MTTIVTRTDNGAPLSWIEADANFTNLNLDKVEESELASSTGSSMVGYLQNGTGAVTTTVQEKLREMVSVFDFLTDEERADALTGTPTIDTTAKIQVAIDEATAKNKRVEAAGPFRIGAQKLVIKCDADFSDAIFRVYGSPAIAIEVSTGNAANPTTSLVNKIVNIGAVWNMAKEYGGGWAGQGVGVRGVNLNSCKVNVKHVRNFAVGMQATAYVEGFAWTVFEAQYYENNKINLQLQPGDATGYVNENSVNTGRFHFRSEEGSVVSGTRHIQVLPYSTGQVANWPNNNRFYGVSLEGDVPEFQLEIGGNNNVVNAARWETSESVPPKVLYVGHASNVSLCFGNRIIGGYDANRIEFSYSGVGLWGELDHPRRKTESLFGAGRILRSTGGDISTTPVMRGFKSDKEVNSVTGADTDWMFNFYARGLEGKPSTDAYPRVHLDWWLGRLWLGTGAAAPTKYISGSGSFLNISTSLLPTADNDAELGFGNTLRWKRLNAINVSLYPASSVTPSNNGEVTLQLTSNTQLTFRVKGSDGTVRSGSITLA